MSNLLLLDPERLNPESTSSFLLVNQLNFARILEYFFFSPGSVQPGVAEPLKFLLHLFYNYTRITHTHITLRLKSGSGPSSGCSSQKQRLPIPVKVYVNLSSVAKAIHNFIPTPSSFFSSEQ